MDQRDLDRAIDEAAAAMMAREPSRALGYTVMARVRGTTPPAPRRLVWVSAAAGMLACAAIATIVMMSGAPVVIPRLPAPQPMAVAELPAVAAPSAAMVAPVTNAPPRSVRALIATRAISRAPLPPADVLAIEPIEMQPIEMQPIVLTAIDVPQLERETTSIDAISIEPLTIEPLAASND
jgi:hypothetical protein